MRVIVPNNPIVSWLMQRQGVLDAMRAPAALLDDSCLHGHPKSSTDLGCDAVEIDKGGDAGVVVMVAHRVIIA